MAFAGEAFTQSPLTTDQGTLQTLLGRLRSGVVEDGTAIGNGLATAINRLRESNAKSKVIILLTDGENNRGEIAPLTAAEIARDQGIRVYTIGVGTRGTAPYPTVDFFGNPTVVQAKVQIDEKILGEIADLTGGRYFRATDNAKLQSIYDEINQLEKSKVEISQYTTYTEEYLRWAAAALALLLVEFLLRTLWLKSLPSCSDSHIPNTSGCCGSSRCSSPYGRPPDSSHAGASAVSAGSKPSVRSCPTLLRGAGV